MASEEKGMNGIIKVIGFVGSVIGLLITIYVVFHQPLVSALANEKDQRQVEDSIIHKEIQVACVKQEQDRSEMKIVLATILTKLEFIERKVQ